jgi:hypothetical protein
MQLHITDNFAIAGVAEVQPGLFEVTAAERSKSPRSQIFWSSFSANENAPSSPCISATAKLESAGRAGIGLMR